MPLVVIYPLVGCVVDSAFVRYCTILTWTWTSPLNLFSYFTRHKLCLEWSSLLKRYAFALDEALDLLVVFGAFIGRLNFSSYLDSKHPATSITTSSTISTVNSTVKYSGC